MENKTSVTQSILILFYYNKLNYKLGIFTTKFQWFLSYKTIVMFSVTKKLFQSFMYYIDTSVYLIAWRTTHWFMCVNSEEIRTVVFKLSHLYVQDKCKEDSVTGGPCRSPQLAIFSNWHMWPSVTQGNRF